MRPTPPEMLARAKELALQKPSTSYVQRHLGIGYNHATEIMEYFASQGLIVRESFGHYRISSGD